MTIEDKIHLKFVARDVLLLVAIHVRNVIFIKR